MNQAAKNAWILLAINGFSGFKYVPLEKIIGAADAINHDIPSCEVLESAIGWLVENGLVEKIDIGFRLTRNGHDLMTEINSKTNKIFEAWNLLEQRFSDAKATGKFTEISKVEWQQAYETYCNRAMKLIK